MKQLSAYDPYDDPPPWPVDSTAESVWTKIDRYPCLDEWVRGVDLYRTKTPCPLWYRIVISTWRGGSFVIPNSIYNPHQLRLRFQDHLLQFGFLLPTEPKVLGWHDDLSFIAARRVFLSNPDYILHGVTCDNE